MMVLVIQNPAGIQPQWLLWVAHNLERVAIG